MVAMCISRDSYLLENDASWLSGIQLHTYAYTVKSCDTMVHSYSLCSAHMQSEYMSIQTGIVMHKLQYEANRQ